jgi:hypothetical protein
MKMKIKSLLHLFFLRMGLFFITGGKFTAYSKGKDVAGKLSPEVVKLVRAAGLPLRSPFAGIFPNTPEKRIARAIGKLHKTGAVLWATREFR